MLRSSASVNRVDFYNRKNAQSPGKSRFSGAFLGGAPGMGNISCIRKSSTPTAELFELQRLNCASDLAGTEAPRTNVDMARSTIDNSLDPANIRLPSSVGTAVGVGNFDTKAYTLAANIALCHFPAPPYLRRYVTNIIISYFLDKCKHNL